MRMTILRKRSIFLLCLLVFFSNKVLSQLSINIPTLAEVPVIDGMIEQKEWVGADSVHQFIQLEPARGQPASRPTKVYIGQFKKHIYFAFNCYTDSKEEIVGKIQRRDMADDSDDVIGILLDTYYDKQNAYLFMVNPIGTLTDAKVTDDGKNIDFFWDTEWEAHTMITDNGWTVEVAIPFDKIQYNPKADTWGINLGRVIRANFETAWWSEVTENFRVSQGGSISGVNPKSQRLR